MNTAIIGLGAIGSKIARNLVTGGAHVTLATKTKAHADALAAELGNGATAAEISSAMKTADIIILAVDFDTMKTLIADNKTVLSGKIIVDPSNPIADDGKGGFKKTIPEDQSSGEVIDALLPVDAKLVKAFGTLAAATLASGAFRKPDRAVLFYAADDAEAGAAVAELIHASGFEPVSVGGIDQSIRIEVGGDLHEMGKLGRLVSAAEGARLAKSNN